ncbi:hypothetical protein HDF08_003370 [Edaphobacter lichenicola]|uniref:Uncharacterized protein n=1 Tax=Tunturiibacter lichenicola TaxID=2051959 RepID=A0A852VEH8_9BACT|nr:hypothetical protein [Edaphobacter lichenicola]
MRLMAASAHRNKPVPGQPKINLKKLAYLLKPKSRVLKHHIHHASHHVFTIKKPRRNTRFSRNPLQKPQQTSNFSLARHSKKNLQKVPKLLPGRFQESDLRAASRTIPISASPCAVETKAASN